MPSMLPYIKVLAEQIRRLPGSIPLIAKGKIRAWERMILVLLGSSYLTTEERAHLIKLLAELRSEMQHQGMFLLEDANPRAITSEDDQKADPSDFDQKP